jgi:PRC-barrel domain
MAWVGWRLDEIEGSSVGKIEGVYVDARTGEAAWLFAKIGRFGRRSLVPVRDAVGGVGRVWVPYAREVIRGAPRIEPGQTLDIYREAELSAHYEVDRARRLAGRPPGDVTSRPA